MNISEIEQIDHHSIIEFKEKNQKLEIKETSYPEFFSKHCDRSIEVNHDKATFRSDSHFMLRSNCLIPFDVDGVFYFEVRIIDQGSQHSVGIGIHEKKQKLDGLMPGKIKILNIFILFYFIIILINFIFLILLFYYFFF